MYCIAERTPVTLRNKYPLHGQDGVVYGRFSGRSRSLGLEPTLSLAAPTLFFFLFLLSIHRLSGVIGALGPGSVALFDPDPDPALTLALVSPLFSAPRLAPASPVWCVRVCVCVRACVPCTEEALELEQQKPTGSRWRPLSWESIHVSLHARRRRHSPLPSLRTPPSPSSAPISSQGRSCLPSLYLAYPILSYSNPAYPISLPVSHLLSLAASILPSYLNLPAAVTRKTPPLLTFLVPVRWPLCRILKDPRITSLPLIPSTTTHLHAPLFRIGLLILLLQSRSLLLQTLPRPPPPW